MEDPNTQTREQLLIEITKLTRRIDKLEKGALILKAHEKELKENKERFELVSELGIFGYYDIQPQLGLFHWDPQMHKIFGLSPESGIDKHEYFNSILHPDDKDRLIAAYKDSVNPNCKNFNFTEQFKVSLKSGQIKHIGLSARHFRSKDGIVERIIGTCQDISEQKKTENLLKVSELKFSKAFYFSPAILAITGLEDGKIVEVNNTFAETVGYTIEELLGRTTRELNLWTDPKQRKEMIKSIQDLGFFSSSEIKMNTRDGKIRTLIFSAIATNIGKESLLISTGFDITKRKQIEEELLQSKMFIDTALDAQQDTFFLFEPSTAKAIHWNQAFRDVSGYSDEEIERLPAPESYYSPADLEREKSSIEKVLKGETAVIEMELICKDGFRVPTEYRSSMMKDSKGKSKYIVSVGRDITEQKKANEEMIKLAEIVNYSSELVNLSTLDGRMTFLNEAGGKMLGIEPHELENVNIMEVIPDHLIAQVEKELLPALMTGGTWEGDLQYRNLKTGQLTDVHAMTFTLKNPDTGKPQFLANVSLDISDRKKFEKDLIEAKQKAEESDKLKSAFLANMSHEIRTPMNGIMGFAGILKEQNLNEKKQQSFIDIIEKNGERLLNIINDLIDISKVEAGQMTVFVSEVNINEQIDQLFSFFKPEAEQKKIYLHIRNTLPASKAIIKTDKDKFYAIFSNLIKNSIKYTHEGSIEFGYKIEGNYLEFFVKDTGMGITKDKQKSIFKRFVQADQSLTNAYDGAGLGLSISEAYVKMLGGKIWVKSEKGEGSWFGFTIPYNPINEELRTKKANDQLTNEKKQLKNLNILIVEDEEFSDMLLVEVTKKISKEVLHAKTGIEAVEICRKNQNIDIVLMDIKMPEMDGYEATRKIRELNKGLIIIAQTAFALKGDREKALNAGCDEYMTKPIKEAVLLETVNKTLKNKKIPM